MSNELKDARVAFLVTDGFEQVELTHPWEAISKAGATVELVSLEKGEVQGMNHADKADCFAVDTAVTDVSAADYDALVLPGGVLNPDTLRTNSDAISFIKGFINREKPVAAICHGPWTLVEADAVKGKTLTSWPSLQTDIRNAGGHWVDEEVCVDGGLVTSRNPGDLDAFSRRAIEVFAAQRA